MISSKFSKKEKEWIGWYQQGTNDWWNAYYQYSGRRKKNQINTNSRLEKSWFNRVLKGLKKKNEFLNVPFAFVGFGGVVWMHPGFENNGYVAEVGEEKTIHLLEYNKII